MCSTEFEKWKKNTEDRSFCLQSEMLSVVWKSRLYDNQKFKEEWNKTKQYFKNRENVEVIWYDITDSKGIIYIEICCCDFENQ